MIPNLCRPRLPALGLAVAATSTSCWQPLLAASALQLNDPVDISRDFQNFANTLFLADKLVSFDAATALGKVTWRLRAYSEPIN